MGRLKTLLDEGLCPYTPMWWSLFVLQMVFLSLLFVSVLMAPGDVSVAVPLSLVFIVPTTAFLLALLYYCKRQETTFS